MIYSARCQARGFSNSLTSIVTRVFTIKFGNNWKHKTVLDFLNFVERNKDYAWDQSELEDICDFVSAEINRMMVTGQDAITFTGRTMNSVIELSNRWHGQQIRNGGTGGYNWEGLPVANGTYEEPDSVWDITQILSSKRLATEGKKMHHCVGSYEYKCTNGSCGIFNISRMGKTVFDTESMATVEVDKDGYVVQARASCNKAISQSTLRILNKWCSENHIKNNTSSYHF
jgi:hypothetical protein